MGFTDLNKPSKTLGADDVNVSSPNSVFGEILVTQPIPNAQGDFVYNINNQTFTTSSFAGATVTQQDGMAVLQSGTSASGSATIQLRRGLEYRPGQGSMLRETAIFDTPDAGNAMFIGAGTAECGYFVGYFGESFGILHSETGAREIRRLDITTGATTGNATVTLNGSSASIAVAGGSSPEQTAYQLALGDYSQVGTGGWLADAQSGSVYFISARAAAAFDGSYSVAGSSIVGSFTQVVDSVAQTSTFIPSGSFNIDKLDGSGPSGMTINPQRGNVYQVAFQYLGFGNAVFSIENPETGKLAPFHQIKNANSRTTPVLKNPNLFVLATSANIGGTTSRTLKTVSMASFTEGNIEKLDPKFAKSFSFSGLSTSNVFKPLALLKSNRVFNDQSNFGEFDLLRLAVSNETAGASGKTITIGLFLGAIVSGEVNFQYTEEQQSIVSYAELNPATQTINNLSDLTPFYQITAGPSGTQSDELETLKLIFQIGRQVLIAVKTSGSATGTTSVNWFEQQ
jgi:hypothetical protein